MHSRRWPSVIRWWSLLSGAVTLGTSLGVLLGVASIVANRYLGNGFGHLALAKLHALVDRTVLLTAAGVLALACTRQLVGRWPATSRAAALHSAAWVLIFGAAIGWHLATLPRALSVTTIRGALLYGGTTLLTLLAAHHAGRSGVRARWPERFETGLRALARTPAAVSVVILVVLHAIPRAAPRPLAPDAPNVLLLTIDTLRADHLGVYGYGRNTSPHIDRLAQQGTLFHRALTQWPKTSPSIAALMTGTYSHTNGVMRSHAQTLPARWFTLAELLSTAGYSTAAAVANVNLGRPFAFDQGFDSYSEVWDQADDDRAFSTLVTEHGIKVLRDQTRQRPFFLWLHYLDPHAPYRPPAALRGAYLGDAYFDPSWTAPLLTHPRRDLGGIPLHVGEAGQRQVAFYVAQYDAEVRAVDEQVGRVLRELATLGLERNTVVILTSDHGESLGEHNYYFEHGRFPYDDCLRVPLIVRGASAGQRSGVVRSPVGLVDILPTILEVAGLRRHGEAEGHSLRPLLERHAGSEERFAHAFSESGYAGDHQRTIATARYKLVYVPDEKERRQMTGSVYELYDLDADPGETLNLFASRPELVDRLARELSGFVRRSRRSASNVSLDAWGPSGVCRTISAPSATFNESPEGHRRQSEPSSAV